MSANKKFKILLIQLPTPEFAFKKHWGNVPLAASYLKAMAYKEGLLNEVEIEILGEKDTNLSSDSRLFDLIISKSPVVVGFSLYLWNSIRSIFIAEEVKKKLPNIKIVVGGPEVTLETKYILDNPVVDIGCIGEGEFTFVEIIKNIIKGKKDYANIKGIFYRKSGQIVVTSPCEPIKDLNQIPSPFILGFINPRDYRRISYETIRGCPFKCSYCVTGLMPMRYFSADRICEDLKVILKTGEKIIRFVDSDFTLHPNFYEICEKIKEINSEKKLGFEIFVYGGRIDRKRADLLKECNFILLEIGLQSIKPATLENVQRPPLDRTKFITVLRLLKERKISYTVDIMIGLPNDTIRDLRKTLKILKDNKIRNITPFVLVVMPGTRLRREAKRFGIKYQSKPPYLLIETDYISIDEIEEAINLFRVKPRPSFKGTFISYCNPQYPRLQKKEELINFFKIKWLDNSINKVIIEVDPSCQRINQLRIVGKGLSRMIYQPFTVWFKSQNVEKALPLIESFLSPIVNSNPFLIWNVILETDNHLSLEMVERVKKIIHTKEKILTDACHASVALRICAIFSWKSNNRRTQWLDDLRDVIPFFWSLNISNEHDWRREIGNLFREKHSSGILIDFVPKSKMDFIVEVLQYVYKKTKTQRKTIFFRNLAFNYLRFAELKEKSKDISAIKPEPEHIESILSIDKNMNILSLLRPSNETVLDLMECQIRFQKVFESSEVREI